MLSTPRFEHDCDKCKFLGQVGKDDAYFCPEEDTVVLRDGNDGPEYSSMPRDVIRVMVKETPAAAARWSVAVDLADDLLRSEG